MTCDVLVGCTRDIEMPYPSTVGVTPPPPATTSTRSDVLVGGLRAPAMFHKVGDQLLL